MPRTPKIKVLVTGHWLIDRKLRKLPYKVQGKIVRPAVREGLKIMAAAVKERIQIMGLVETGAMRKAIKVMKYPKQGRGQVSMEVRVDPPDKFIRHSAGGHRAFYPAVQEYGSAAAGIPARPFMHVAFANYAGRVRRATIKLLKDGINREIEALA